MAQQQSIIDVTALNFCYINSRRLYLVRHFQNSELQELLERLLFVVVVVIVVGIAAVAVAAAVVAVVVAVFAVLAVVDFFCYCCCSRVKSHNQVRGHRTGSIRRLC